MQKPVTLESLERFHHKQSRTAAPRATPRELVVALVVSIVMTPFFFVTFFVLPMMGQITVGFAGVITAAYFYARRSFLIPLAALSGAVIVGAITFQVIQGIKYHLEVPLFVLLVLGVPLTAIYCIFLGTRIWVAYNPNE